MSNLLTQLPLWPDSAGCFPLRATNIITVMTLQEKIQSLKTWINKYDKAAIAFSGGVDSTFLSKIVFDLLGSNCLAITVDSMFIPREEMVQASELVKSVGIPHEVVKIDTFDDTILSNPENRCYHCKHSVFSILQDIAERHGIDVLFDGSNVDDLSDFRPGMKALEELKIQSPLLECGFTKSDIREASRLLGLSTWNKPSKV